jgi:hypothetical protein
LKTGNQKKAGIVFALILVAAVVLFALASSSPARVQSSSQLAPSSGLTWPPVNGTVGEPAHPWFIAFVVQTPQGITFRNSLLNIYHNVDVQGVSEVTQILRKQYLGTNAGVLAIQNIIPLDRN